MSKERTRAPRSRVCLGCGIKVPARARFCGACGTVIGAGLSLELSSPVVTQGTRQSDASSAPPLIDLPATESPLTVAAPVVPQGAALDLEGRTVDMSDKALNLPPLIALKPPFQPELPQAPKDKATSIAEPSRRVCPKCGGTLSASTNFCGACGAKIAAAASSRSEGGTREPPAR